MTTTPQGGQPPKGGFYAQPPPPHVPNREWAMAFLQAQSPNPEVRKRGRDALDAMGCEWVDNSE